MSLFSDRLIDARKRARMTQREAAAAVGTTQQTLSKYETGKIEPPIPTIEKFAQVYGVPVQFFFSEAHEVGSPPELDALIARSLMRMYPGIAEEMIKAAQEKHSRNEVHR